MDQMRRIASALLLMAVMAFLPETTFAEINLIANPGLENGGRGSTEPDGWLQGGWGANTRIYNYPVNGPNGISDRAVEVKITSYWDGDAKWYFQEVPAIAGQTYLFTDQYKCDIPSWLVIQFRSSLGAISYGGFQAVPASPNSWSKTSLAFTPPPGTASLTVFHLIAGIGTLDTDNYGLVATTPTSALQFPDGRVTFDLDDSWANQIPLAQWAANYNVRLTFFAVSQLIDQPDRMTSSDLRMLVLQNHEINAHTRTHPDLTQLDPVSAANEIVWGQTELRSIARTAISAFAYPYGKYNGITDGIVRPAFAASRTSDDGFNTPTTSRYRLKVKAIDHIPTPITLDTVKSWMDQAQQQKTWLIILFHQINTSGSEFSFTPDNFQAAVKYALDKKLRIVTINQGIQDLYPE